MLYTGDGTADNYTAAIKKIDRYADQRHTKSFVLSGLRARQSKPTRQTHLFTRSDACLESPQAA
jgi:hypothetical protein